MEEEEKKSKIFKPNKKIIIAIAMIIIVAILIAIAVCIGNSNKKEAKSLHELIYNSQDNEGEYAKIDLAYVPYNFAIEDEKLQYYFAIDKEGYMYIVRLTNETYNKLQELQDEKQSEFSYELKGYVFEMPEELRQIAIESYNEISEKTLLTDENLEEYIGSVYLDETMIPGIGYKMVIVIIVSVLVLFGIAMLIIIVTHKIRTKENKEREENVNKEEIKENKKRKEKINKEGIKEKIKKKFIKKDIKGKTDKKETEE